MSSEPFAGPEARTSEVAPPDEKPSDVRDGVAIRYDPAVGTTQRLRFEPRAEGGFTLYSEEWTGCTWRVRTQEPVNHATIETTTGEVALSELVAQLAGDLEVPDL
jgi:hypothetical protein